MPMNQNGRINNEGDAFSILVVGDLILDTYVFGTSNRLSPEAPVPVMNPSNTKYAAGGAANVALNLQSLGAKVTLCGITGRDEFSSRLVECLGPVECHIQKENITTTQKTRYLVNNQQVMRLDRETIKDCGQDLLKYLPEKITRADTILISDYDKHLGKSIPDIIRMSVGKNIVVDPKTSDWNRYRGSTTITPNFHEYVMAGGDRNCLEIGCEFLRNKFDIKNILLTLGAHGMAFSSSSDFLIDQLTGIDVVDTTGAGDTAVAAWCYASSRTTDVRECLRFANAAAGSVCQELGTAVVDFS
jgi:D-beta-D-heptose 7-phosphate kinase / D-beta-D-heptose 1-phosphate adenosyltransferase